MNAATPLPPQLPAPDLGWLAELLDSHAIPVARLGAWTRRHLESGQQTGAGAYVYPHFAGPRYRDEIIDVLVDAGYTIADTDTCVSVEFPPERW